MNLDKTSTTLKKINRLFEIINEIGEANSTEQDLLKAYVEDLYSAVSDGETIVSPAQATVPKVAEAAPIAPITPQVEPKVIAPAPVAATPAAVAPAVPAVAVAPPKSAPKPAPAKSIQNPELAALFELDEIHELSDKLSSQPIKNLTKCMGINERIFTVNELFGGDNAEFNNIMKALNGLGSFDEAKQVLIGSVAEKHQWSSPDNFKKAQKFIKLVKRRYN